MSLVREALQKAEREAAARAARERGLPEHLHAAGQPYRARRRGLPFPVLALLVALPLFAGAAFVLWILGRGGATPPTTAAVPAAESERQKNSVKEDETGPASSASDASGVGEPATDPISAQPAEEASVPVRLAPVVADASPPQPPPARATAPAPARGAPPAQVATETYVREAVLDGGATRIELGGIAWSEAAPLAYLNGKLRGAGENVAGLEIRAIERDRVVLATRDRTVVLTLR
jgi:hypothetical protein